MSETRARDSLTSHVQLEGPVKAPGRVPASDLAPEAERTLEPQLTTHTHQPYRHLLCIPHLGMRERGGRRREGKGVGCIIIVRGKEKEGERRGDWVGMGMVQDSHH